ncbi:MAG: FtsX-like permease family protein, partial [Ignavibacteriaceae bacterium]
MNLSTARSGRRSKEVGIRKTLGSNRAKLMWQFISEAVLMSSLSVIIAIALLEIILPLFNRLSGKSLELDFINIYTIPALIIFILVVGVLAGSYPAFYLSSFQPVKVLKAASGTGARKSTIRSSLVILQFTISISLLISTIVIKDQLDFIQNKKLGFKKDHLYSILNASCIGTKTEAFKNALLQNSNIISVSNSSQMFRAGVPGSGYLFNKKQGSDPVSFQFVDADYDFLKTYQVELKEGRFFSKKFSTDSASVLINETAARIFGDTNPTGKEMTRVGREDWSKTYRIIGVIKDFNYESLHQQVRPLAIHLYPPDMPANVVTVKISSAYMKETLDFIEGTWKSFTTGEGMYARFVDENLALLYETEEKTAVIASVFSGLAIFIACLGLFGLAAFVTEQRTKEIGIRKVLGASVTEIIMILSKEFAVWVLIANIISWPIAYYFMQNWLQNFAFRTDISWNVFAVSGLIALLIALFTVGMHAVKAAKANPVDSLKYE